MDGYITDPALYEKIVNTLMASEDGQRDLLALCVSNTIFAKICYSEEFWKKKYEDEGLFRFEPQSSPMAYLSSLKTGRLISELTERYIQKILSGGHFPNVSYQLWVDHIRASDINIPEMGLSEKQKLQNIVESQRRSNSERLLANVKRQGISSDNSLTLYIYFNLGHGQWRIKIYGSETELRMDVSIESVRILIWNLLYDYHDMGIQHVLEDSDDEEEDEDGEEED